MISRAIDVSIIMPAFNSANHIVEAIQSVQRQTYAEFELLVVDGGSTDGTQQKVRDIAHTDARVRLVENENDSGPAHARYTGIKTAAGRYIAFLDADDVWLPEKLQAQMLFMSSTGTQFCFTRYRIFSDDGARHLSCLVPMRKTYTYRDALSHRGIGTLTVMIERVLLTEDVIRVWRRAGGEELLWWLLMLRKGAVARRLDRDLARYRDTTNSLSKNKLYTLRTVWSMYRSELGLSRAQTAWHYSSYVLDSVVRRLWLFTCGLLRAAPSQ